MRAHRLTGDLDLLWIDYTAGALVGLGTLAFSGWLSALYRLPEGVILGMAAANLTYPIYSFNLARRARRPVRLIELLAVANLAWSMVCLWLIWRFAGTASGLGIAHLALEAGFVGGLGALEWRARHRLADAA